MNDEVHDNESMGTDVGTDVYGDNINIRDITNAKAIAVGSGASVTYSEGLTVEEVAALVVELKHKDQSVAQKPLLLYEPLTAVVPAGVFLLGDNDDPLAAPQHSVDLPEFAIGVFPVTNEQYAQFVWKNGQVAAKEMLWDGNQPPAEHLRWPVTGVTWFDALAYCNWLSAETGRKYTLPSEAHWEKAARGIDGRFYPWGDAWQPDRCHNIDGSFVPVDKFPPQSPYGCYDMVGNAREWTTSLWGSSSREPDLRYRYPWQADGRNDLNAPATTRRIFRGGRGEVPADYRCAKRGSQLPDRPGPRHKRHGFRVMVIK